MTADPSPVAPARAVAPVIAVAPRKLRRLKPCFSVSGAASLFWSLSFIRLAPIKDVFNRTSVLLAFRSSDPVAQPESCRGLLVPACSAGASSFSQPGAVTCRRCDKSPDNPNSGDIHWRWWSHRDGSPESHTPSHTAGRGYHTPYAA